MEQTRYYKLELKSEETASTLERDLQRYVIQKKIEQGITSKSSDITSEFDVIYSASRVLEVGKPRILFISEKKAKIELELIVKGEITDLQHAQEYITLTGYDILEVRQPKDAVFGFCTAMIRTPLAAPYQKQLQKLSEGLTSTIHVSECKDRVGYDDGSIVSGYVSGDVQKVITFKEIVTDTGLGIKLETEKFTHS